MSSKPEISADSINRVHILLQEKYYGDGHDETNRFGQFFINYMLKVHGITIVDQKLWYETDTKIAIATAAKHWEDNKERIK